jgi:hypothetical protein
MMMRTLLILAAIIGFSASAFAQTAAPKKGYHTHRRARRASASPRSKSTTCQTIDEHPRQRAVAPPVRVRGRGLANYPGALGRISGGALSSPSPPSWRSFFCRLPFDRLTILFSWEAGQPSPA